MHPRFAPVLVQLVNSGYAQQAHRVAEALRDEERGWLRHIALMATRPGDPLRIPLHEDSTVRGILSDLAKQGLVEIAEEGKADCLVALTKQGAKATYTDPAIHIDWPEKWLKHFGLKKVAATERFGIHHLLDTLIKQSNGFWTSEEQGKDILEMVNECPSTEAVAWANRQSVPHTCCFFYTFSRENAGRTRNIARIYLLDKGGVVLRGIVKVTDADPDGHVTCDWTHVAIDYRRPPELTAPFVVGDPELARARRVEKNRPLIQKIKTIPGWESRDLLVEFLKTLEEGRSLAPSQTRLIERLVPDDFQLADVGRWENNFERFINGIVEKILPAYREIYKDEPTLYHEIDALQLELKHRGFVAREHSLGKQLINDLEKLTGMSLPSISLYGDASEQLYKQHIKAFDAKEPNKKALKVEAFIQRAADKLMALDVAHIRDALGK